MGLVYNGEEIVPDLPKINKGNIRQQNMNTYAIIWDFGSNKESGLYHLIAIGKLYATLSGGPTGATGYIAFGFGVNTFSGFYKDDITFSLPYTDIDINLDIYFHFKPISGYGYGSQLGVSIGCNDSNMSARFVDKSSDIPFSEIQHAVLIGPY